MKHILLSVLLVFCTLSMISQENFQWKGKRINKVPELNHLFQHSVTGLPDEYATIEETFSPEVMETIGQWILERK